ncbi:thiol-disulfide isomerase/thioredoxin [Mucilaginibacter gracilis]|uniref:Thiol-disulfide isomerase/thioredoxin n=1 Tax=Mucilaginibacter gracilis TaxID=423350 RepID=A0A495IWY1_9SPHI|nr:TlpA disulfide reductase family protein [Mucilaginibacter gracilis]RKR80544.1 thiol-disulfide isomerase/thioredoxin [Mucilaginibacter gracilis]
MVKSTNLKEFLTGIFLALGIYSCGNLNIEKNAVIKGDVQTPKNGKIYLLDISKKDVIKDSANVVNGKFIFTIKSKSSFMPFEAALSTWRDTRGVKGLWPIGLFNPYRKNYIESTFFVDRGITSINKVENQDYYEIRGSKQNEPFYRKLQFGDLNKNQNAAERNEVIAADLKLIKKYPYSFYLLNLIYLNRELFTINELNLLTAAFNDEARTWTPYDKLKSWMAYQERGNSMLPNIVLKNENGGQSYIFDDNVKFNMLVFWASWCGPCRKEIPVLKEIYQKYHNNGLSITNISIDNNENSWKEAVAIEKMPWKQLIANDSTKGIFNLHYNISSIPVIVLVGKNGELIQRFEGSLRKEEYYKTLSILDKE